MEETDQAYEAAVSLGAAGTAEGLTLAKTEPEVLVQQLDAAKAKTEEIQITAQSVGENP